MKKSIVTIILAVALLISAVGVLTACGGETGAPESDPYSQYVFTLNSDGKTLMLDVKYKSSIGSGSIVLPTETYYYADSEGGTNVKHDTALPVSKIADGAFEGCTGITSVTVGDSYLEIGESAFKNCTSLETVSLSRQITAIPDYAFAGCEKLESVKAYTEGEKPQIKSVGTEAFKSCMSLRTLELDWVSGWTIGDRAFFYTTSLRTIDITNASTVGEEAFKGWFDSQTIVGKK